MASTPDMVVNSSKNGPEGDEPADGPQYVRVKSVEGMNAPRIAEG
jgi:hypothetical protein